MQHYVQAPEARPVPDGRAPSGLQQQQQSQPPQQQQREKQQQQQQQELCLSSQIGRKSLQKSLNPQQQKQTQSRKMASGLDIPYDISWVFPRLRKPSTLWYVTSQIVITLVGLFSKFILGELTLNPDLNTCIYILQFPHRENTLQNMPHHVPVWVYLPYVYFWRVSFMTDLCVCCALCNASHLANGSWSSWS